MKEEVTEDHVAFCQRGIFLFFFSLRRTVVWVVVIVLFMRDEMKGNCVQEPS